MTGRFGRFTFVGFIGAMLQLMLVSLLTKWFGVLSTAATLIAVEIALLHNFIWHEHFTWGQRGPKNFRQLALRLLRFHAGNGVVSLAGNTIVMYCLVERLKTPVLPTAVGAIVLCSLANFLIANCWVFPAGKADLFGALSAGDTGMAGGVGDGLCHQGRDIPVKDRGHDVFSVQFIGRNHRRDGVGGG